MKRLIAVCGARGSGKTMISLGLIQYLKNNKIKVGAWKPVDIGHLEYNSLDIPTDGQRLKQATNMTEHISSINPYLFNQILPPVLAARQDGVKIDLKTIDLRLRALQKQYHFMVMESLPGMMTPFFEDKSWIEQLKTWNVEIIWVSGIGPENLENTLSQVKNIQAKDIPVHIILNNFANSKNAELLYYQWITLEEQLSQTVLGLLPFLSSGSEDLSAMADWFENNIDVNEIMENV